jgi:hypothetical protein
MNEGEGVALDVDLLAASPSIARFKLSSLAA